jgi:hypothetical protein
LVIRGARLQRNAGLSPATLSSFELDLYLTHKKQERLHKLLIAQVLLNLLSFTGPVTTSQMLQIQQFCGADDSPLPYASVLEVSEIVTLI